MSKLGLFFSAIYVSASFVLALISVLLLPDAKGRHVVLQLPIALQGSILEAIGMGNLLDGLSWSSAYLLIGGGTAALLYLMGLFVGKLFKRQ